MTPKRIIKSAVLHILAAAGYVLLLPLWRRNRNAFRILTYHSIGDRRPHETNVSSEAFDRQMAFLASATRPVAMQDIFTTPGDGRAQVIVTMDDGYADNLDVAQPILARHGIPAVCFLTADYVGTDRLLPHDARYIAEQARLLTWDEAKELARRGITIGSHGKSHLRLSTLDDDAIRAEMSGSMKRIHEETGVEVVYVSFPFGRAGDFDQRAVVAAREAGYCVSLCAMYGTNRCGEQDGPLRRIGVESSDTLFTLRAKLNGALDLLALFETLLGRSIVRGLNALTGG